MEIQNWLTLCGVSPASILSLQASACLDKEHKFFSKYMRTISKKFLNLKFENLCKNESFSKTIFACLTGAQGGSIHEKKLQKNLVKLSLWVHQSECCLKSAVCCLKSHSFRTAMSKSSVIYHWHVCDRPQRKTVFD